MPYKSFTTESLQAGDLMEGVMTGLDFDTQYYLVCEAYDRIGNKSPMSGSVTVTTGPNHAPVIATEDPLTFTLKAHETHFLNFTYSDPDGHGVHAVLDGGSPADTLYQIKNLTQKAFIDAAKTQPGNYTSTLHLYDDYEMETTLQYSYTVLENHSPVLAGTIDNQVFGSKGETRTFDLSTIFNDSDGETLTYVMVSSDNDILNLHIRTGVLYVTALKYGYASGTITASDRLGASVSTSFSTLARDGSKAIDIYPTTVTDGKLYLRTPNVEQVVARVISETGAVVLEQTLTASSFPPAALDMSALGAGPYSVQVELGGETFTQNIVKL